MSERIDIKIFIASSGELEAERKESALLIAELNKRYPHLHLEPVLFEIDTPAGNVQFKQRIQDGINPILKDAHIAVILFYTKAGEFTLEEMDLALKLDKKVFVYFKEGFTPQDIEELNKYAKVLELKAKLGADSVIRYQKYKSITEYYGLLSGDLGKYIDSTYPLPANIQPATVSSSSQYIPLAPRAYLAHPYAIVKNFTGRREEMARLTEWFKYDKEPMCIIEAIGGMGKSALCWRWLQDEVIVNKTDVEGVIWWSFYDQGFEDFIHHLYEYCIPEEMRNRKQRIDETTEVINALTNRKFLLVLDGFERVLRGYAQMMSMYIQEEGLSKKTIDDIKEAFDVHQRTPVNPRAEKLLRALCAGNSKTLITTRLYPATIEDLAGVSHIKLSGLSKTDTIAFFKTEGITGTDEEMIRAGEVYGFHPLMLKLLSTAIKRSFTHDIKKALQEAFSKGLIDEREPKKILGTSYQLLNRDEQKVVSTISVFRTAFTFDAVKALFPEMDSNKLEGIMMELCNLGFLLYNDEQRLFDFHPILRSYLYDRLTGKHSIHQLAITYFAALPAKEKIITLADLEPVIEQFNHLALANKYNDAARLFIDRLHNPLFYQLAQYDLCINLCELLLSRSADSSNKLSADYQASLLNVTGICYYRIGQLNKTNQNYIKSMQLYYYDKNNIALGIVLKNAAATGYFISNKLTQTVIHFLASLPLVKEDPFTEAEGYILLGESLIARARLARSSDGFFAENYFEKAIDYCTTQQQTGLASGVSNAFVKLVLARVNTQGGIEDELHQEAWNWAEKAIGYVDDFRVSAYPVLQYFLVAYEAISLTLIAAIVFKKTAGRKIAPVLFYDEHFQHVVKQVIPEPSNYVSLAENCINEGLTLARKANRVYDECTFSLLLAQIEWLKIAEKQKGMEHFKEVEKILTETQALAQRIEYRMLLTDLHLFCAEVLIKLNEIQPGNQHQLLNYDAKDHLKKAREYALDTSDINDIFLPDDGTADEFYKDIPEYFMLKRGLTDEERIKNGYYLAWLRADKLEKQL